ncbi:Cytochrome C oxidase subunit II, periplasmic domain [Solimicrobium silvestre]|uniref:Cytochrome C oxidase subunit II, periplasmic domain n=2 Tax=Solimicrobium silvestre TaxID=2099400 RepID=A0A2S9GSW0_9BURK|nr:Cytochrome C oxidase subunit II, periplasmic domain [Solimicrobium silvestre]
MLIGSFASLAALLLGGKLNAQELAAAKLQKKERVIKITAKKFSYSPNQITIKEGEHVVLELTSLDFMHGFNIPDLTIRADLLPGQSTKIHLGALKEGKYEFLCDNFCGNGHEEMNGTLIVTT